MHRSFGLIFPTIKIFALLNLFLNPIARDNPKPEVPPIITIFFIYNFIQRFNKFNTNLLNLLFYDYLEDNQNDKHKYLVYPD